MNYLIGMGKSEITPFVIGAGMMGYGQTHNTVQEVATPLFSRALLITNKIQTVVLVNIEVCFVTIAIKDQVIEQLTERHPDWKLNHENVLITAQHTHSAPGGYSHYPLYNFTIPGFSPKILKIIVDGIVQSIEEAYQAKKISTLSLASIEIPPHENVAINRSMKAYLANPEAKRLHPTEEWHLALDRTMNGFKIKSDEKLTGLYTWFGVHATSVSSFNHRIHHDNKGAAAEIFEKKNPGVTAVFAQSAAGDISPNYLYDKKLKRHRGPSTDQYESAALNGEIQAKYAQKIVEENGMSISGEVTYAHSYIDMKNKAAPAAHGLAFFKGTIEAPALPQSITKILSVMARATKARKLFLDSKNQAEFYRQHGNKEIMVDHRTGELMGIPLAVWKKLPSTNPEPVAREFIRQAKNGSINTLPWVPEVLPLQLIRLGDVVIAGVPGEITYIAAERLKKVLKKELVTDHLIIASYANAYMGYITTPEEYQEQCYEGGHTVYGLRTLDAITAGFLELAKNLKSGITTQNDIKPPIFLEKELKLRSCSL